MGYSFDNAGRLSCDNCGKADGTTRKRKCPYGYCPAPAICRECWSMDAIRFTMSVSEHDRCRIRQEVYRQDMAKRNGIVFAGGFVRSAAMTNDNGRVKVCFTGKNGDVWQFMDHATYDAIPLGVCATIEDYKAVAYASGDGDLTPAKAGFYGVES